MAIQMSKYRNYNKKVAASELLAEQMADHWTATDDDGRRVMTTEDD